MSEQTAGDRAQAGTKDDRAPSIAKTAVYSVSGGFAYLLADYVTDMLNAHHFLTPPKAIVVMLIAFAVPTVHKLARIFNNWTDHLEKESEK